MKCEICGKEISKGYSYKHRGLEFNNICKNCYNLLMRKRYADVIEMMDKQIYEDMKEGLSIVLDKDKDSFVDAFIIEKDGVVWKVSIVAEKVVEVEHGRS